jgi:uncharacterized protein YndB with AHSA1/START domain
MNCPVEEAFRQFSDGAQLSRWLASSAEVEPFVGGKYELFWDVESRERNSTLGCKVTAIEPNKFIAFNWKGPEAFRRFMNTAEPLTHVVVFFIPQTPQPSPSTEVHLVHSGWGSTPEWDEARRWFEDAWRGAFEALSQQSNRSS